jgi:N-acetylglutamate synthase-like GNAT family acetyltransferase
MSCTPIRKEKIKSMVKIKIVRDGYINLVSEHYKNVGYSQIINSEDIVIAAFSNTLKNNQFENNQVIGAVRLCPDDEYLVLRGMQIKKEYQCQGIGTALLNKCAEIINKQTCYCLPYKHLVNFYQKANFHEFKVDEAPLILKARLENYLTRGLNVTMMKR